MLTKKTVVDSLLHVRGLGSMVPIALDSQLLLVLILLKQGKICRPHVNQYCLPIRRKSMNAAENAPI